MKEKKIGKIKNFIITEDNNLELVITITDAKFKKEILRELYLSGNIYIDGNKVIYKESEDNADI